MRLADLRTAETDRPPLQSTRIRRRPEAKLNGDDEQRTGDADPGSGSAQHAGDMPDATDDKENATPGADLLIGAELPASESAAATPTASAALEEERFPGGDVAEPTATISTEEFRPPLLGWDVATGEEVPWRPAGADRDPRNGHIEIWGSSGMGKTQFIMGLLAQLARHSGSHFGIADFKNDYSTDTGFPQLAQAEFLDLWSTRAPYNQPRGRAAQ